jgi:alpha-tubulin suppressor-like RCC1 family protein
MNKKGVALRRFFSLGLTGIVTAFLLSACGGGGGGGSDPGSTSTSGGGTTSVSRTALQMTAGSDHACAILDNSTVKCWGSNLSGELGVGDMNLRQAPVAINLGSGLTPVQLAAGSSYTCARFDNGSVKCWGSNLNGNLGLGDTNHRGDGPDEMGDNLHEVDLGAGRTAVEISVSTFHTCARLDNGTVKCWGLNDYGQLGLGDQLNRGDDPEEMGDKLPAIDLGAGRTAAGIALGDRTTCVLLDTGSVKCWGKKSQLGLGLSSTSSGLGENPGEMGDSLPPVELGTGRTALAIYSSHTNTCAKLDNNTLKCWGGNQHGQIGVGDFESRGDDLNEMGDMLPAIDLGAGRTAVEIDLGAGHVCARLDNATVKCWGRNHHGQLGQGDDIARGGVPGEMGSNLPVVELGTGRTTVQIAAGGFFSCAILDNGAVKCWGENNIGFDAGDEPGEMGDNLPPIALGD